MAILYVSAKRFQRGIQAGAEWVLKNRDHLNDINVFPVPDGDTGTNMSLTLAAAVRAMEDLKEVTLETTVKATAWGAMMGARGNSGIILAQILSGFAQAMEGRDRLSAEQIALGFSYAVGKAYKALLHPAEGTILTVVRETAQAAEETVKTDKDLAVLFNVMVRTARSSVERTPLLLPRLKEAGVVDAGGLGFFYFLEGMLRLIYGTLQEGIQFDDEITMDEVLTEPMDHNWKNRFCTEFILKGSHISEDVFKASLVEMGDSIVVVGDSRLARIHIHTAEPEAVLRYAAGFGQVSSIKVDDMLVQHTSRFVTNEGTKASSVIAIVLGSGLREVFYNAGAELVVEGGPTHNPSTAEIMAAVESVASSQVIILPNHKNVYPAAVQAAERAQKKITVLKTSSVPEGLSALLAYMEDATYEDNLGRMERAFGSVRSGETAVASRSVIAGLVKVTAGDSIGIYKGEIRCSSPSVEETVSRLVESMLEPPSEIITLIYGASIPKEEAQSLRSTIQGLFPAKVVELLYGGQPFAQYIVGIE